ncbi:MAG: ABC transporter substrate-binding protein [Deltaproteobacteria bacterium]|nr:ABC transporter substrate-binding protein [Deltaproteobacteria bacterium]
MKSRRGRILLCLIGVLVLISLTAVGAKAAEPVVDEWRIPAFSIITGPLASAGEQINWAIDYNVRVINESGGMAGRPIVVEYHDTAYDPGRTVSEMSKVVGKAFLIWGPMADNPMKAAMPLVIRHKSFNITPCCGAQPAKDFQPWTVTLEADYPDAVPEPMAKWIELNPDIKTVVQFVWPESPTWMAIAQVQREALEAVGVKVLPDIECSEGVDFGSAVIRAMSQKADAYTINFFPNFAARIVIELDKRGLTEKRRIMLFCTAEGPELYEMAGKRLDGCYHWSLVNPLSDYPRWQKLLESYHQDFPDLATPPVYFPAICDMVLLTKWAVEELGITGDPKQREEEASKLREFCRNADNVPGVMGEFNMVDGFPKRPGYFFQIRDGKKVSIPLD